MANPSPTCQVKEGSGAWQDTTDGVDVTAGSSLTIRLVDTSPYAWSLECIGTDETNSVTAVNAGLVVNNAAKTATLTAPAVGSALLFRSTINGGVAADGTARPSYSATFKVSVLTATGFRVGAFGETIENDSNYGTAPLVNELVRTVDGLVSGTATKFTAVGAILKGQAFVSANDVTNAKKVKVATSANLDAASYKVIGLALADAADGATFDGAAVGTSVDQTIHGLTVDPLALMSGFAALDTSTGRPTFRRILDGADVRLGTFSQGTTATMGVLTIAPELPAGTTRVNLFDPRWGVTTLPNGDVVYDAALNKIFRKYGRGGVRVCIDRQKSSKFATTLTSRNDEVTASFTDLNASDFGTTTDGPHVRYPTPAIALESETWGNQTSYGVVLASKLRNFGYVPGGNAGKQASILSVDKTRNMMTVQIPLDDIMPPYVAAGTIKYGQFVRPSSGHTGYIYRCNTIGGGTMGTEPTWQQQDGAIFSGGGLSWECFLERPTFPLALNEWINHYIAFGGADNNLHRARFLVMHVVNDGANGSPVQLLVALRGSYLLTFSPIIATGTAPPTVALTNTALTTIPIDLRIECTLGGARGTAQIRYSYDGGSTWAATGVTTAATITLTGAGGVQITMATGTYSVDNVWTCRNLCGNDAKNGSIRWTLERVDMNTHVSQYREKGITRYKREGYFSSAFIASTMSGRKGSQGITDHIVEDALFSSYPPGSYSASPVGLGLSSYSDVFANGSASARQFFVDSAERIAWPVALDPGHFYYRNADGAAIAVWTSGGAVTTGQVFRPTDPYRNGFQYRAQGNGTFGGTEPTGSYPTTHGATFVHNSVTYRAEWECEVNTTADWAAGQARSVGDIRRPTSHNGFRLRCVVAGTTGATEPAFFDASGTALINRWDRITDGSVQWSVEFDLGSAPQTSWWAPLNNDYHKLFRVSAYFIRKLWHVDNPNGQAREHIWTQVNPVLVDFTWYCGTPRYTNEVGTYGQLDWNGGDSATTQGIYCVGSAQDFKLRDLHAENTGRIIEVGGAGSTVVLDGCRFTFQPNGLHYSGEWAIVGAERLTIRDSYALASSGYRASIILNHSITGTGGLVQKVRIDNFTCHTGMNQAGQPARIVSARAAPWDTAVGTTLSFDVVGGTNGMIVNATLVATLQSGDVIDATEAMPWEWAKRINADCGKNWKASTSFAANSVVVPGGTFNSIRTDSSGRPLQYQMDATGGTTGATEPNWPTTIGATVTDNGRTWTCQELSTAALFAYTDALHRLFVEVKGVRGQNASADQQDSPMLLISALGTVSFGMSASPGTAAVEMGMLQTSINAYAPGELAMLTDGILAPSGLANAGSGRAKVELTINSINIVDVAGATTKTISGEWELPYTGFGATLEPWWTAPRQKTVTTVSGSVVPLLNTGGPITFSGTSPYAGLVFDQPEWDTGYAVDLSIAPSATTGSPAAATSFSYVKSKYGIRFTRTPVCGAATSETRDVVLTRPTTLTGFDPSKCTSASLKGWFKNESIPVGLDYSATGWVNSATGTNLVAALKQSTVANQPTISNLADGLNETSFDGTNDYIEGAITTPYSQPVTVMFVAKYLNSTATPNHNIISGKVGGALFLLEYYPTIGWYLNTGTRQNITGSTHLIEDAYHVISVKIDRTLLGSNTARRTHISRDNSTPSYPTTGDHGSSTLSTALILGAGYTGSYTNYANVSLREVLLFSGALSKAEERQCMQWLANKFGTP